MFEFSLFSGLLIWIFAPKMKLVNFLLIELNFRAQNKRNHILLSCILARICEEFSSIFFALKIREITFSDDVIFWRENPNIYTYIFFFIKIYFCRYWLMYKLNSNFFLVFDLFCIFSWKFKMWIWIKIDNFWVEANCEGHQNLRVGTLGIFWMW